VIYSSAPPWTGQVAAWAIATLTGRPWVADFRDPWARGPWRQGRLPAVAAIIGGLERRAVTRADAIIFTSHAAAEEVAAHYGAGVGAKLHVVRNGCNVREFGDVARREPTGQFVLLHTGSLYGARNPAPLLAAIATLVERGALDRNTFRLRQIGPVALGGVDLRAFVRERKIEDIVEFVPRMPRGDALREIVSASALLLIQPSHPLSIPAKTFEYFAAQRPILALTDESETARIVRESGVGLVVSPTDEAALAEAVLSLVAAAGNRTVRVPEHLFDGDARAREMVSVIGATALGHRSRPGSGAVLAQRRTVAAETRGESSRV
jgi:glycosyltransferase involved in cell wall biosynthesis